MHVNLGGYHIKDIQFSAAIDVAADKVGKDLNEAIFAGENNTVVFNPKLAGIKSDIAVKRGMVHDGMGRYLKEKIAIAPGTTENIVKLLKETDTDVVVNYLPVGSEEATKWYVEQILQAGCAMVNCIPVFIASSPYWSQRFADCNLPIIGDDIKSQVGATITHRVLSALFEARGVRLDRTYQLNFGGNTDFLNMLERDRLESKKISKTEAVASSMIKTSMEDDNIHVGPSDFVPWLKDRKFCYIQMEGTTFGEVPLRLECKLEVWDSPNSAGVVIDAVRCAKLALDNKLSGSLPFPSAYFMKHPAIQIEDTEARTKLEKWIREVGD
jgi:myo-inositol-1-phosphate synthase